MRKLALAISFAALTGCAVGPDYERPAAPESRSYTVEKLQETTASAPVLAGDAQRFVEEMDVPAQWWTLFNAPKLTALVEASLKGNPSLEAAKAALRQAHELYSAQWANYFPVVQGNFSQQRAKDAVAAVATPSASPNPTYSLYTAQLTLSYAPDIFGSNTRAVESAKAQMDSQRFQLEAAYLTLTSTVVVTAIQEAGLRAMITATERLVAIEAQLSDMLRRQREVGTATQLDLLLQQATEAQTAATLPPLVKQLNQAHDAMAALLGRFPDDASVTALELNELALPHELPVSLPTKLVEQRPDVRQAEENLHAATANVGVALADLFPQFSIDANLGSSALRIGDLFTPYTGFWSFGTSLTQTLFDAGALLHKRRAADAAMDQAAAQYRNAVLGAVQNVADTLRALQTDADAVKANNVAAGAAQSALQIIQRQNKTGTVGIAAILTAEVAYQQAVLNLIQAQASRFADTAGLFQSLGGGWWNRHEEIAAE